MTIELNTAAEAAPTPFAAPTVPTTPSIKDLPLPLDPTGDDEPELLVVESDVSETPAPALKVTKKAKTKVKTVKKAKAKKKKALTGQSGPAIADLPVSDLNRKELRIANFLYSNQDRSVFTIVQLAAAFPGVAKAKANSWVRNSLRKPVRGQLFEKVESGAYRLTLKGLRRMQKAA
jgi:hypothetical protein